MRVPRFLILSMLCAMLDVSIAKPTEVQSNFEALNPVQQTELVLEDAGVNREQRSPQFGFVDEDYSDYSEYEEERGFHKKHKHHKHKPEISYGFHGGHYGGYKPPEHYHPAPSGGGSFATASAGSIDGHGSPHGSQSHVNAQSASFSFGPYSATFSVAEASSGHRY